jgi:hypothetical protein
LVPRVSWQRPLPRGTAALTEHDLIFPAKSFYDTGGVGRSISLVAISGTLTGKGIAYPNNQYSIGCYGEINECVVAYVEAIGGAQVSRMSAPARYPIVKFTAFEVVAQEELTEWNCIRTTFTIDRRQQMLLWVDEPINQTKPACKNTEQGIRKYTIEDSASWKRKFDKK